MFPSQIVEKFSHKIEADADDEKASQQDYALKNGQNR
jgi:hypothetical protein